MAAGAPPPYSEVTGEKTGPSVPGGYPPAPGYGTAYPSPQAGYPPSQPGYPPSQPGYAPPQPGYPQPGYQTGTAHSTVVVNQPQMTVVQMFHETPVRTTCPHCRADIVTATTYVAGTFSWLICAILCLIGFFWGCCLIPFCVNGCQDVIHTCPNCQQQISRWSRM